MKSKFLDQDIDEVLLLAKNVLLVFAKCFINRNYDKILKEMGKVFNSSFDILFLGPSLCIGFTCVHVNIKVLVL